MILSAAPCTLRRAVTAALLVAVAATGCGGAGAPATTALPATSAAPSTTFPGSAPTTSSTTTGTSTSTTTSTTTTSTTLPSVAPLAVSGPGRYEAELISGGMVRRFVLVVPESAPAPAPLVMVFHGLTRSPEAAERQSGMSALAEEHGFLVVYPAGSGAPRRWLSGPAQGNQDVVFVRQLVALISEAVPVDPLRVYAAGLSNGGGMVARLACDAADLVAAVGPVAAAYPSGACDPSRPVPVAAFHGTADPIVPYTGVGDALPAVERVMADWALRNGCDPEPTAEEVTADVVRLAWNGCDDEADLVLFRVIGGRHGWPGSGDTSFWGQITDSVSASALLWEFFAAHPMP